MPRKAGVSSLHLEVMGAKWGQKEALQARHDCVDLSVLLSCT